MQKSGLRHSFRSILFMVNRSLQRQKWSIIFSRCCEATGHPQKYLHLTQSKRYIPFAMATQKLWKCQRNIKNCIRSVINMRFGYDFVRSDWITTEPQTQVVTTCTARFNGINCNYVLNTISKTQQLFLKHHQTDGVSNGSTALSSGY
jgi:hypothetical protein